MDFTFRIDIARSNHNVTFVNELMSQIRKSIKDGDFLSLKELWLS